MRIVVLLTDGYGCLGGIAQYNRDMLSALNAALGVETISVWPRRIIGKITDEIPESVIYERRFARSKWRYALHALRAIIAPQQCDLVICAHLHLLPIAWLLARRNHAVLGLVVYGIEAWRPTSSAVVNFLSRRVDHLIPISRFTEKRFRSWARGRATVTLVPPCVDLNRFTPGEKSPDLVSHYVLEGCVTLMSMGRLAQSERYKGVDELIDLMPRLGPRFPQLRYIVVGDGDDRERLIQKAMTVGVAGKVIFVGRIAEADKVDHYRLADVFALPSTGEGFGIVLIEAAACGAKVIGSAVDGAREAMCEGELGAIVDPADCEGLYNAIEAALTAQNPRRCNELIEHFSKTAFERRFADWLTTMTRA